MEVFEEVGLLEVFCNRMSGPPVQSGCCSRPIGQATGLQETSETTVSGFVERVVMDLSELHGQLTAHSERSCDVRELLGTVIGRRRDT